MSDRWRQAVEKIAQMPLGTDARAIALARKTIQAAAEEESRELRLPTVHIVEDGKPVCGGEQEVFTTKSGDKFRCCDKCIAIGLGYAPVEA